VDRYIAPYLGWPAPVIGPAGAGGDIPPQFQRVDLPDDEYDLTLLQQAGSLVLGHAIYCAHVDTTGRVVEWVRARPMEQELLGTDSDYSQFGLPTIPDGKSSPARVYTTLQLARDAAAELEQVLPHMLFLPARAPDGTKLSMWVAVTPAVFR